MNVKKLCVALVVVFVGFWLFTDPNGLADAAGTGAQTGWDLLTKLFDAIINFLDAL